VRYWEEHGSGLREWPYPIRYDEEREIDADVLVLGGGIAGCWAAISAARKGLNVAMVEKGATIRSGGGGGGCDHWYYPVTGPYSKVDPDNFAQLLVNSQGGYDCGIARDIQCREAYDTLLELEKMGGKVRDTEDEFKGAEFRDEETKLMFAYDYDNKIIARVWGSTFKPALKKECDRLGVNIYDRVMLTSLLTEGGIQGARVVGATGFNDRTGEFMVFKAKATILCTANMQAIWTFSSETTAGQTFRSRTVCGDGTAMAWRAGAALNVMERTAAMVGRITGHCYPAYGTGNPNNTWYPCTMVDENGKELPYVDKDGNIISDVSQRLRPGSRLMRGTMANIDWNAIREGVIKGEYALPFYADLPGMPEMERRIIWGMMVGEEGSSEIVLNTYEASGFRSDKDQLQSYQMIAAQASPQFRSVDGGSARGGVLVDWDLKTTLEGLYCAGDQIYTCHYHSTAATTGRYAGRKAADYAMQANEAVISRDQVAVEKTRVYAPINRSDGIEWKELHAAIARAMQNYCSQYKTEALLNLGLDYLKDIEETWVPTLYALDPHKLMRGLEDTSILTCAQIIVQASLARKASSNHLDFHRLDYPEVDPPEWAKYITIRQENGKVKTEDLPLDYYGPLKDNYETHNKDYTGVYEG